MSCIAVKGSLRQFCKDDYLTSRVNDVVVTANKIIFEAYCFANLHIIKSLKDNKSIPILNQSVLCSREIKTAFLTLQN